MHATTSHAKFYHQPPIHYRQLGTSDLKVSKICLGTMTRGYQNTEADAHQQLGYAIDQGINRRHHHGTTQESFTFTTNEISLRRSELLK